MQASPYISIVFIVGNQRERAVKALANILAQKGIESAEVLIFDTAFDQYPPLTGSDHPSVKIHEENQPIPLDILRAKAVELSGGEIVAFVEDHAYVVPGWLETLIRDFRAGHGGVGGEPDAINPGIGISDAVTLMGFGFFRPTTEPRTYDVLPGHNSAYRRDLLLSFGELLPALISSEILLDRKIIEKGHTLLLDPGAKFLHHNEEKLSMIAKGYYYWNVIYGQNRARIFHWPWWRRLLQGFAIPLVPFVRYMKYMIHFWSHDRKNIFLLLRYTGIFLYAQSAAAVGLARGTLFGTGDAEMKFRDYELNYSRRSRLT